MRYYFKVLPTLIDQKKTDLVFPPAIATRTEDVRQLSSDSFCTFTDPNRNL